jgi:hypothetical protein
MSVRIQLRRDTAANWASTNPTLTQGEPGYETDTGKIKYGDGSTAWDSLAYAPSAAIVDGTIVNADVNASAAIAGTKISPNFGSQNLTTTGTATAAALIPSGSSVPTNGVYLPSSNNVAISTNGVQRINIEADGDINIDSGGVFYDATNNRLAIGTTSPAYLLHIDAGSTTGSVRIEGELSGSSRFLTLGHNASGQAEIVAASTGGADNTLNIFGRPTVFGLNAANEYARIDSSGRLLVGTSTSRSVGSITAPLSLYESALHTIVGIVANNTSGGTLSLASTGGSSVGSNTLVANGQTLGVIRFAGADGTDLVSTSASIQVFVDGTPGVDDMPGRLVLSTTSDGASSPSERMRITSAGNVSIGGTGVQAYTERTLLIGADGVDGLVTGFSQPSGTGSNSVNGRNLILRGGVGTGSGANGDIIFQGANTVVNGNQLPHGVSERLRVTSNGQLTSSASSDIHHFIVDNTASTYSSRLATFDSSAAAGNGWYFLACQSSSGGDNEFLLRGDGVGLADGSWIGGGADYAEYFEWNDSNPTAEDRRGISVVLDGNKIRHAVSGDDPIGVISGNPSVVGDAASTKWIGKYLRDDYGTYIQEDYEVEDEDGNTVIQQRRKLNPAYDPDVEYTSREERPEWDCVGLMGKLRLRKGQPTGSRWIKMRDISDSVEEWLVR